ncbi:MAG: NEW3 domain-containing protein [Bacillota bacterium]|nr:NEW3 domain-containing protein [Bacillota bacterium]
MARRSRVLVLLLAGLLTLGGNDGPAAAAAVPASPSGGFDPTQVLTLGNEYVVLGVTRSGPEAGRFALETTGGAPDHPGDDGKPLIYGRPRPWTSYTTVRVDGRNFVFGGPSNTRAGRGGEYGQVLEEPVLRRGAVETACLLGEIEVRQILELAESSTSGLVDTVRIVYEVTNRDVRSHRVGLRIMLDTMLGENDGAPIRMGERTLTGDNLVAGNELPSFWQAFDSLSQPSVMAQGTVADPTTVRPDRSIVTNWGNLADHLWEVPLTPGREFVREGEKELDSAVALYWDEEPLGPGETRLYATAYGLGGVTIIPGELTLGITAPATAGEQADGTGAFAIVAYVENVGKWPANGVSVTLRLPEGLELAAGEQAVRTVGNLAAGAEATLLWKVNFRNLAGTVKRFRVEVSAAGLAPVVGERSVTIQGPPRLNVKGRPLPPVRPSGDGFFPERVTVEAAVANGGPARARLVKASLLLPDGWQLARLEKKEKFLGTLEPGEERTVTWVIRPDPRGTRNGRIEVRATAANARPAGLEFHGEVPALSPRIYPVCTATALQPGRFFRVNLQIANVEAVEAVEFDVEFDAANLAVVGVSRGELFVAPDGTLKPFAVEGIDNAAGRVGRVKGRLGTAGPTGGTLLTLHLLAKEPGEARVGVSGATIYSANQAQQVELGSLRITIGSKP